MSNRIALIVGRFQPFHKGHLFLIKKALEKADKVIIGIGSANILDVNNPIDYETRRKIIKAVFYKEGLEEKLASIVPIDDFFDDEKWLSNLKSQVGRFDVVVSNNDWTNRIMEKAGFQTIRIPYYKRELYEGWRIRKLIKEGNQWQDRVPKYIASWLNGFIAKNNRTMKQFNNVVLGGTFDHFHKGHEALIKKAFEIGKKVTIGIATEELYKNKFLSETVEPFKDRNKSVTNFINHQFSATATKMINIIPFSEFTGGVDKRLEVDAIVVSRETFPNAIRINELRKQNHLKPMMIVIIEDVLAENGKIISSERIRTGEIDRNGKIFELISSPQSLVTKPYLTMPKKLRMELQKPLGKVFDSVYKVIKFIRFIKPIQIIAVGDIITNSLLKENINPDIKIIDLKSRRKRTDLFVKNKDVQKGPSLVNKPGTINLKTAEKLKELIQKRSVLVSESTFKDGPYKSWLVIDGEEDLLALPAILFAPLDSLVLYGHWKHGIIAVEVDEEMKEKVKEIIEKFP
jgi:nicotinamide-nucleotide adenylyltransferase